MLSRLLVIALASLLITGIAPARAGAAPASPGARTVASEWKETLEGRRGRAVPGGRLSDSHGVRPSRLVTYTSPVHKAAHGFNALGPHWKAAVPPGASVEVSVRTSVDGVSWKPWRVVTDDHGDARESQDGRTFGSLVVGDPACYAQYRVVSAASPRGQAPAVSDVTLTYLDTTSGPTTAQARSRAGTPTGASVTAVAAPSVISRAAWGADERLRFDAAGKEKWPRRYVQATKAVLHDTETRNNDPNPAATMRAVYYYHAVTQNWGDIRYNYLIDEQGNIYEGRAGGENVAASHGGCYGYGSVGIAALGHHKYAAPSEAMVGAFKRLLAWKLDREGIDPLGRGVFMRMGVQPLGEHPNIMAHIDATRAATPECPNTHLDPGPYLYDRTGEIRRDVSALMGYSPTPNLAITDVALSPTTLDSGGPLRVQVTVRNTGTGLAETQAPTPGTAYAEGDTWGSRGFAGVSGKYRVYLDRSGNASGAPGPYRWGLGAPLLPGQERVVSGYVTPSTLGSERWSVGLVREGSEPSVPVAGADITVVASGAGDATGGVIQGATVAPATISPNGDGVADDATVAYSLSSPQTVKVDLYDAAGMWVKTIQRWTPQDPGPRQATLSGTYFDQVRRGTHPLADGRYDVRITARQVDGATREARVSLSVEGGSAPSDTEGPQVSSLLASGTGPYTLSYTLSEKANVWVSVADSTGRQVMSTEPAIKEAGRRSVSWSGKRPDGTPARVGEYTWNVYAVDLAGNRSAAYPATRPFAVAPLVRVVDNAGAGFGASTDWATGTYGTPYAGDHRYRRADGSSTDRAAFSASLPVGAYDVYAWYSSRSNRTTSARYAISHAGGTRTVYVNQQVGGGAWKYLGTFNYNAATYRVTVYGPSGSSALVIADAVRWVRR